MKYAQTFRITVVVLILSMLVLAMPVALAQETRSIELWPLKGKIGETIEVIGQGFNKSTESTDKYAAIFFSSQEATTSDDIDDQVEAYKLVAEGVWLDEDGALEATFTVPGKLDDGDDEEDVIAGTYYVYVCHYYVVNVLAPRIRAVAEFTVTFGEITIDPDSGSVDTLAEITGTDFTANTSIAIEYDGSEVDLESGDDETDSQGEFVSSIIIPESIAGAHSITVTVSGTEATTEFTVEPEIFLSATSGEAGTMVTVEGAGFGRKKNVVIYFNNSEVSTATTDVRGSFSTAFNAPDLPAGIYGVEAKDESKNSGTSKFTIVIPAPTPPAAPPPSTQPPSPTVSTSSTTGSVGTDIAISGASFAAGGTVTIEYDGVKVTTAIADAEGFFMTTFKVPASKYGGHTITISDGINSEESNFIVESEAPPVPAPLLPKMGANVKPPISFDWEDITDDSLPITYILQIAASSEFSAASMVLEKQGLMESKHTVAKAEATKLVEQEAPYYWRVRAIDAASNEGEWASASRFSIAPSFTMPSWAIYAIIVLGVVLIFGFGIGWFTRRRKSKPTA
jgi:hypothetical protein